MSWLKAVILGVLQGLTEFFPVSSSAHLKLAKLFLSVPEGENQVLFDLMCHMGTLMALLFFLRLEIPSIFKNDRKKIKLLFLATLPLIPCYFLLKPLRDFASQPQFLGLFLMVTAFILFAGNYLKLKRSENPSFKTKARDALWIGTMQSAALVPGISRSASTISCANILGWEAKEAVRFSFLLSIPTIIGGNCLELIKIFFFHPVSVTLPLSSLAIGFLCSGSVGLIVIRYAIHLLEKGNLKPFAWYCLTLGITISICFNFL
jgi:undecaprenyl-diphosphatase